MNLHDEIKKGKNTYDTEGKLHSFDDKPAEYHVTSMSLSSYKKWYRHGVPYREGDKPVEISGDNTKIWLNSKNQLHRLNDKPAMVWKDGNKIWALNDQIHRENDKPAKIDSTGQFWYKHDMQHREGGKPAAIYRNGGKEYFLNDREYDPSKPRKQVSIKPSIAFTSFKNKIKFSDLINAIQVYYLEEENKRLDIEGALEFIVDYADESKDGLRALGIKYNKKSKSLNFPLKFNFKEAYQILNDYLEAVEELNWQEYTLSKFKMVLDDDSRGKAAYRYFVKSKAATVGGGDDVLQDFLGNYVFAIIEIVELYTKENK